MSRKKRIIIASFIVLAIVAVVLFISMKKKSGESNIVQTVKAEKQKIIETVTATGKIQPKTQVKISADVAAKITHLNVKEGNWVNRGDLMVQLDRERFLAALEQTEANLRSIESNALLAKENLLKAEKEFSRTKELFQQNLESQAIYDQAYSTVQIEKARHQSALEQVDQAKGAVKQSRDDLSKTSIYAPMSGTISELNKEVGEIALGSQFQEDVIMVISNLSEMEALVDVDENDIVTLAMGDSANIDVDALPDRVFKGVVSEIASSAKISGAGTTEQKTEFEVKIRLCDPSSELRPGMTASSDIITDIREQTLGVPIQCVTVRTLAQLKGNNSMAESGRALPDSVTKHAYIPDKDGFVQIVFTVEEGLAKANQVRTGIQSETNIEIVEGLTEGDEVITGSYRAISQTLHDDASVAVKNENKQS